MGDHEYGTGPKKQEGGDINTARGTQIWDGGANTRRGTVNIGWGTINKGGGKECSAGGLTNAGREGQIQDTTR